MPRSFLSRLSVLVLAVLLLGTLVQGTAEARRKLVYRAMSLNVSTTSALTSAPVRFAGRITRSPKGSVIAIQRRAGSRWVTVRKTRTRNAYGTYRTAVRLPSRAGTYTFRALSPKRGKLRGAVTRPRRVKALIRVTATLSASATTVPAGSEVEVTGTVKPFQALTLVSIQKQVNGSWTNYRSTAVQSDGTFSYPVYVGPTTPLRVSVPATGFYAATYSPVVTVTTTPVIATSQLPDARQFQAYSGKLTTIDGAPGTWSVENKPGWLVLNPTTGALGGTPNTGGSWANVRFSFTSKIGETAPVKTFQMNVLPSTTAPTITTTSLPHGVRTDEYAAQLQATGPGPDLSGTWSVSGSTPLPNGLALNSTTGAITGTPTAVGETDISVSFTQGNTALVATKPLTITVDQAPAPTISTSTLAAGTAGSAYSASLAATGPNGSGGTAAATGTWSASPLPAGLSLNTSTGVISGTPTSAGSTNVVVTFTQARTGLAAPQKTIALAVKPAVTTATLPVASTGAAYSATLTATGGNGGTWTASPLPAGITLDSATGELSGTPTAAGSTDVVVTYSRNGQTSASTTLALAVKPVIVTSVLPGATRTIGYSFTLDGTQEGTWTASPLPDGLSLNSSTGAITGTPTTLGTTNVVIGYTVNGQTAATKTLALVVGQAATPVITTSSLPAGTVGTAGYSTTLAVTTEGSSAGTWSASPLPPGLSLNTSTGVISGTPTASGTTAVVVGFTQTSTGLAAQQKTLDLVVNAVISTSALPDGTRTQAYSAQAAAVGSPTGTWAADNLPSGLSISSSGAITGTPTAVGTTDDVVLKFTQTGNGGAPQVTRTVAITINEAPAPVITTTTLGTGTVGSAYTVTLAAQGDPAGTWSASPLPAGLSLNTSTGVISGTPTTAGSTNVVLGFTQTSTGLPAQQKTIALAVKPVVTTATLPAATTGTAYSVTLAAAGGSGGTWTATPRPAGISIDTSTGELSGTPTAAGSTDVVITYTVNGQTSASRTLALAVKPVITTASLPHATRTEPYSFTLDGSQTGTWSASPLPAGLSLNTSTGAITGTPTAVGSTNVVIGYTVNGQAAATTTLALVVDEADPPVITTSTLPDGTEGVAYSQQVQAQGNPAGTWSTDDPLPAGLTIDSGNGTIAGTPTVSGDFSVTVLFTQTSTGLSTSKTFSLHLEPAAP